MAGAPLSIGLFTASLVSIITAASVQSVSGHHTSHATILGTGGRRLYDGVQEDAPLEPPLPLLVGAVLSGGAALGVALAHVAALQHEVVTVAEAVGVQPCNQ